MSKAVLEPDVIERQLAEHERASEPVLIEFCKPSELKSYSPPEGMMLIGNFHIVRGSCFVVGGPPGVGKSRSVVALAQAGATRQDWFGLTVHRRFKTMIIQAENGRYRLKMELSDLGCESLDEWVRITPPPPFGFAFEDARFRSQLMAGLEEFKPDVVVLDPWNRVARDEKAKEYLAAFELIQSVLPTGDDAPALGIVAHTRKPKADERASGRALLNLLAGSYVLGSIPRTAFVMQAATDDTTDNRVVWTCCKNNDGELGARSAWERRNGLFVPVQGFDWDEFDNPGGDDREKITEADLANLFDHGKRSLAKSQAVKELAENTGAGRSACYNALRLDGRFSAHLREDRGLLTWVD